MRFSVHLRAGVRERLSRLAGEMVAWADVPRVDEDEASRIRSAICPFDHTTKHAGLSVGGVDGSGDYPALSYGDSFVYVTVAHGTRYQSDPLPGLKEQAAGDCELLEFSWIPEDDVRRARAIDAAFERMVGQPLSSVIASSDYRLLKDRHARRAHTVEELHADLIRPHAADAGNLAIQLRSVGELSSALRLIRGEPTLDYVLYDSTFSLPFVSRARASLFHEHVKRLCCVEARERGVGFLALSKSHGLPAVERIEELAAEVAGTGRKPAEHWFMRLPVRARDGWEQRAAAWGCELSGSVSPQRARHAPGHGRDLVATGHLGRHARGDLRPGTGAVLVSRLRKPRPTRLRLPLSDKGRARSCVNDGAGAGGPAQDDHRRGR